MRVALIQSDERRNRAALAVARALRAQKHTVTLLVPQKGFVPATPDFTNEWRTEGFDWVPVSAARLYPAAVHFPREFGLAAARTLSGVIAAFDVAWFFERHWAMPTLRDRRFRIKLLPLVVLDAEGDPEPLPSSLEEINYGNSRRYALQWADGVIQADNAEESVRRAERLFAQRCREPDREIRRPETDPAVTVCIAYFEAAAWLPQTLQSLTQQTSTDFTVVVVDDGSETKEARLAFDACARLYADRGWKFIRQANRYAGAAKNRAAQEAKTEFLLFLDSDDIAMPEMVERFLRAALLTGDDCLAVPNYGFREQPEGPCSLLYDPPGNSLIGSMADDMHGGGCIFVRRQAFCSVGGFTELRGLSYDDYEFHVRCNLKGLRWDVLPEFIYRYRMPQPGSVSRSTPAYGNGERVRRWYEERLRPLGLCQLPLAIASAFRKNEQIIEEASRLSAAVAVCRPQKMKLLLMTCHFPFAFTSGWHLRARAMIRYFGSRYELTLITPMQRDQIASVQGEVFRYIHALRGVELGGKMPEGHDYLIPLRVREQYRDTFRDALWSLPTHRYHAAIVDQIFMAEYRKYIATICLLTEHNIESRVLWQRAERSQTSPEAKRKLVIEAKLTEQFENRHWPEFWLRGVVSQLDAEQMRSRVSSGKIVVAPNGADPSTWLDNVKQKGGAVLFVGHLGYPPNIDAVEFLISEIWPEVRKRKPQKKLILAGRSPAESVTLAARAAGIEICANPPLMDRVARQASLTVAPLRLGSGTRCKILESMAWGLPVVSTSLGCEGIEALDGEHLLIRDDPVEFAEAIVRLTSDAALWQKLRKGGRDLVRDRYSWEKVFEPLDIALLELVS